MDFEKQVFSPKERREVLELRLSPGKLLGCGVEILLPVLFPETVTLVHERAAHVPPVRHRSNASLLCTRHQHFPFSL